MRSGLNETLPSVWIFGSRLVFQSIPGSIDSRVNARRRIVSTSAMEPSQPQTLHEALPEGIANAFRFQFFDGLSFSLIIGAPALLFFKTQ